MATTYTLISSTVLTGSQATVTFSSIPSGYTDLVLKVSARSDGTGNSGNEYLNITFNGTTSGYSLTRLRTLGTSTIDSANVSAQAKLLNGYVDAGDATASTFGNFELYLPSYTASQNKPSSGYGVSEQNTTTLGIMIEANLWSNTAAITSMNLFPTYGTGWVSGSSFYLYGIKNS